MANLQHIADRIFRYVDAGRLDAGYASCMGALIDAYDEEPDFHEWMDTISGSVVEKLIACMTRQGKWDDPIWLMDHIQQMDIFPRPTGRGFLVALISTVPSRATVPNIS
jgi:hypothetical protein